jgi:predicted transposase/invertase (TIGR01784 family)
MEVTINLLNRKFISNSNSILKEILNSEENVDILQNFIEKILKIRISKIFLREYLGERVRYLPVEEKYGIADVRVITEDGSKLNIGVQIIDGNYVQEKILTYASLIHINQLEYDENNDYAKTITINILDFKYFSTQDVHKVMNFLDRKFKYYPSEEIEFHILELPKFKKSKIENFEDAWIAYLKGDEELAEEAIERCEKINKLDNLLKKFWEEERI